MKIGDLVMHKNKKIKGRVAGFMKRNSGVLVNYSDHTGVKFRWVDIKNLEVISEYVKEDME